MKTKLKIKLGFFAILLLGALAISSPHYFPALICSVTVHELGHIFMAKIRKIPLKELKLGICGAYLLPESKLFSYADEIILCLGGPTFNFISVLIAVCLFKFAPSSLFVSSSLALGFINLLPIQGFDGGRIASAFLHRFLSPHIAHGLVKLSSFVFIFSLWTLSLYLLMKVGSSLTLFVFSVSMFVKIFLPDTI